MTFITKYILKNYSKNYTKKQINKNLTNLILAYDQKNHPKYIQKLFTQYLKFFMEKLQK